MEKHLNKKLEETTDKLMSVAEVEKPSSNFTASIMQEIQELEASRATRYRPLISKPAWAVLSLVLVLTTVFLALNSNDSDTSWLNSIDFNALTNNKMANAFSSISLSKTLIYAIGLFGIMLCVQIPVLKHLFDKRFQV
ncbi:hypothetical protein [Hanstruepera marina]|uniref:hypothetical protein n=1 Tax=Hanstruepera marina TaxID=2873265 RepID=UPI001CA69AD0|nr:hypothetical protein [Hanstruepera marina]